MSSMISLREQLLCVSNHRFASLLEFAVQVAGETAQTAKERDWTEQLHSFAEQAWPGIGFDLDQQFLSLDEKKFWARVFDDLGRRIFLRLIGRHDVTFWQSSAIGDAYIIARMLAKSVQEVELAWHPISENSREGEQVTTGEINIQM